MNKELLFNTLSKYKIVKYDDILFCEVDYSNISFYRLREAFYYLGIVLEEDEDESICVAKIKSGFLNQNETVIAAQTHKFSISFALYSEEGIIKQKSSEKTLNLILERLKNPKAPKKNGKKIFGSIFIVILLGLAIFIAPKLFSLNTATELTKAYNTSIREYNNSIDDYNALAKQADLSNVENFVVECIFPFNYFRLDARKPHVFVYFSPLFTSLSEIHYGNESFCIREPLIPIFHNLF